MLKTVRNDETIVIAIGGNSLVKNNKQFANFSEQMETIEQTTESITDLIERGFNILVTHGNGPQVGDILIRSYLTRKHLAEIPLEIATAITQSQIGYMIQHSLKNKLLKRNIHRNVVTIITQVIVEKNDPAFSNFTKPVGPFYSKKEAYTLQAERNWIMKEDAGRGFRRIVSSPKPQQIVEIDEIRHLLNLGTIVIAGGGGGIPIFRTRNNQYTPTAAVIDKDSSSALMAKLINAKVLLISTSVDRVYINFNKPNQKPLYQVSVNQIKKYIQQKHFEPGSMLPKVLASVEFLSCGKNKQAVITDPKNISKSLTDNKIGTKITC